MAGNFSGRQVELELEWTSVNQLSKDVFDIEKIPDLKGLNLVDNRFPTPLHLGIVGGEISMKPVTPLHWKKGRALGVLVSGFLFAILVGVFLYLRK